MRSFYQRDWYIDWQCSVNSLAFINNKRVKGSAVLMIVIRIIHNNDL